MALSFSNLILTPSIISGVNDALNSQQINTLYGNILIDPGDGEYFLDGADQIVREVGQYPGVVGASPHLTSVALIEYGWQSKADPAEKGDSGNWRVIGIDPDKESDVTTISQVLLSGSYLSAADLDQILLGVEIAGGTEASSAAFQNLGGVRPGDRVRLTYPNGIQREYTVKGIFKARDGEADRQAFVSYAEMVSVMGDAAFADRATQILVRIDQTGAEADYISAFQSLGIKGQVRSWEEYGGAIGGVVSSFNVIASLIGGIGLIVAAIVMFIVIYINVINKKRQIGILRAIGVSRFVIYISYLSQALFYAVTGIVIGGLLFGLVIEPFFAAHPLDLSIGLVSLAADPSTIRNAAIGIIVAAVLAGVLPVVNIARHSIIRAIWG
jgi:putative ABC transport system permease protein